jgi:hypothetical protein
MAAKPKRRGGRLLAGLAAAALVIFLLSMIPYQTMREERMFALGSQETFAKVVDVAAEQSKISGQPCRMVSYRFVDRSGVSRNGASCLPPQEADIMAVGAVLPIIYATGNPDYSEAASAVQSPVKRWIREWARGE